METLLSGVRVLDFTWILAGPYATMVLADLGAEVIKIEPPTGRLPISIDYLGEEVYFFQLNKGKKSIVLDMKSQKGRELFYELVKKGDVVISNFSAGVPERMGIDYDTLKKINPKIIVCEMTPFGRVGPFKDYRAYDAVVQAIAGSLSMIGEIGGRPLMNPLYTADLSCSLYSVVGILTALYERERTGVGRKIETTMLFSQIALYPIEAVYYLLFNDAPGPVGRGEGLKTLVPPFGIFKTKDSHIIVAGHRHFPALCKTIGKEEWLQDPRFNTREALMKNKFEIYSLLDEALSTRTTQEWFELLQKEGVPCAPINTIGEALSLPYIAEEMVGSTEYKGQQLKVLTSALNFPTTPRELRKKCPFPPPTFGQHTDEILSRLLGYPPEEIARLRQERLIH